ncbi:unnamed protein product [Urochloa humidicola]
MTSTQSASPTLRNPAGTERVPPFRPPAPSSACTRLTAPASLHMSPILHTIGKFQRAPFRPQCMSPILHNRRSPSSLELNSGQWPVGHKKIFQVSRHGKEELPGKEFYPCDEFFSEHG